MRRIAFILTALLCTAPAMAQVPATQPAMPLGKQFRSRIAGIELNPPAFATQSNELANGEIARFVNLQESWDLRIKPVPLHLGLPLSGPNDEGMLELTRTQFTESTPTAEIVRCDVLSKDEVCRGAPYGLIESRYDSATDRVFSQQAIFRDSNRYYLILQMTSHGRPKSDTGNKPDPQEESARGMFNQVLRTVHILDRSELRKEQDLAQVNTHMFWMGLDEKKIVAAIQPLHFVRIVRDGKDVGFIQMNERQAIRTGNPGVEVIVHSRLQADLVQQPPAFKTDVPTVAPKPDKPSYYYTSSSYFVTFDRKHEGWTTTTQLDDLVMKQTTESANSDMTIKRKLNTTQAAADARTPTTRRAAVQPPVLEIQNYTLDVAYAKGPHQEPPTDIKLVPYYLPQAIAQLLPRLLPSDSAHYMFAFYVSAQKDVIARYVDVGLPCDVDFGDQKMQAIPISDRIGVDGPATIHYVTRSGEWLGSVTDDSKLMLLPTDESTLKGIWPGFVASPLPPEVEVQNGKQISR